MTLLHPLQPTPSDRPSALALSALLLLGLGLSLALTGVLACSPEPSSSRPNVLVILVDTLRADRLTPYGASHDTSPAVAELLAGRGTTFEQAYAPAPWTLPSMVGLMTGRSPGELVRGGAGAFALPEDVPVLAERLSELGYATAGFYANPTLHRGNGFARGFDTFYTPPPELASLRLHGDTLLGRVLPWLQEQQQRQQRDPENRPFFLYVHFLDPHDPYDNPANEAHRWPWLPAYDGPLTGDSVHGLYTGALSLGAGPATADEDRAWISALYDGEVAYVDGLVRRLLEALDPEVLADTLVVFTADHGEELYDHRGWKHGETLYQEQLRVPLILRWDAGPVPAGARIAEPASLLDLLPTIVTAAGGEVPAGVEGVDLLNKLVGDLPDTPPLHRALYARHFGRGPLRAGVVLAPHKLVLFNRQAPFAPSDEVEAHLWRLDFERLARVELYDLQADPHERHNLAGERPDLVTRLAPEIHRHLDRELPGLRVVRAPAIGSPDREQTLAGRIDLAREPERWAPLFLGPDDRVELAGRSLTFELTADVFAKGFLVEGDLGAVEEMRMTRGDGDSSDGGSLEGDSSEEGTSGILVGADRPYRGGEVDVATLETDTWPGRWPENARLRVWTRKLRPVTEEDPETVRGLRNLGYVAR